MRIRIYAIDKELFSGEAVSLTLPASEGQITVLDGHLPIVSLLKEGTVVVRQEKGEQSFGVRGGFVEVHPDQVTVLAE